MKFAHLINLLISLYDCLSNHSVQFVCFSSNIFRLAVTILFENTAWKARSESLFKNEQLASPLALSFTGWKSGISAWLDEQE